MKDNIIIAFTVATLVLLMLICHKYTYSSGTQEDSIEQSNSKPVINTIAYDNNYIYQTTPAEFENIVTSDVINTDIFNTDIVNTDINNSEEATTSFKSILDNNETHITTKQFNIIQNN